MTQLTLPFLFGCVFCALILWILLRTGWAWSLATDVPTHRSLHTQPTPRVGGWGIAPVCAFGIACFSPKLGWLAVCATGLAVVCQIDDRRGLTARVRFGVQLIGALVLCMVYPLHLHWWLWPIVLIGMVWMTNLYNFMDGADGLAGGMAVVGFGAYAVAGWAADMSLAMACAVVAGAAAGFLIFNLPPARLFMGDAGSIPLGFLAGGVGLIGWRSGIWELWFPIVVFLPFIGDATVTLLRRLRRGERVWEAHREHFYQRMIQMDQRGHRPTMRWWYACMVTGAVLAVVMLKVPALPATVLGMCWGATLIGVSVRVDRQWVAFVSERDAC